MVRPPAKKSAYLTTTIIIEFSLILTFDRIRVCEYKVWVFRVEVRQLEE
jgi:hypothetical protein